MYFVGLLKKEHFDGMSTRGARFPIQRIYRHDDDPYYNSYNNTI